jgi:predicted nucleic acid-binding protein
MSILIFLDTGVIGKIIHPDSNSNYIKSTESTKDKSKKSIIEAIDCNKWLDRLINKKYPVAMSEIVNYETRREHIRRIHDKKSSSRDKQKALKAIEKLDKLVETKRIVNFPVTCEEGNVMQKAAELWAFARLNSYISHDADLLIAAQAIVIKKIGIDVMIATTDTEDFNRLLKPYHIEARRWNDIEP